MTKILPPQPNDLQSRQNFSGSSISVSTTTDEQTAHPCCAKQSTTTKQKLTPGAGPNNLFNIGIYSTGLCRLASLNELSRDTLHGWKPFQRYFSLCDLDLE